MIELQAHGERRTIAHLKLFVDSVTIECVVEALIGNLYKDDVNLRLTLIDARDLTGACKLYLIAISVGLKF